MKNSGFSRTRNNTIEWKFNDSTTLTITKSLLRQALRRRPQQASPLQQQYFIDLISENLKVEEEELVCFLLMTKSFSRTSEPSVFNQFYMGSSYDIEESTNIFNNARSELIGQGNITDIVRVFENINEHSNKYEIVYLPTYRRVEKILESDKQAVEDDEYDFGYFDEDRGDISEINYGLTDVENRIKSLTRQIRNRTLVSYRQTSADIVDDLLRGKVNVSNYNVSDLPDKEYLKSFLSRIQRTDRDGGFVNSFAIEKLYSGEDKDENQPILVYFLSKLSSVIKQTQKLESQIELFVYKVNQYLSMSSEKKQLVYKAGNSRLSVETEWAKDRISLNDLSSGEKQVVSLLSLIYLSSTKKIVLIDEPELSLSLDWQQRILVDILEAPSVVQLLAITHSPFIFDNELEYCAQSLNIERVKSDV